MALLYRDHQSTLSSSVSGEECRGLGTASAFVGYTVFFVAIDVWPTVASSLPSNTRWRARHHWRRPRFPWGTKPQGTKIIGATSSKEKQKPRQRPNSKGAVKTRTTPNLQGCVRNNDNDQTSRVRLKCQTTTTKKTPNLQG